MKSFEFQFFVLELSQKLFDIVFVYSCVCPVVMINVLDNLWISTFHHEDEKELYTAPVAVLDETKGKNVNIDTHKEIHKRNIRTGSELEKQKEDIKKTVMNKKKVETGDD